MCMLVSRGQGTQVRNSMEAKIFHQFKSSSYAPLFVFNSDDDGWMVFVSTLHHLCRWNKTCVLYECDVMINKMQRKTGSQLELPTFKNLYAKYIKWSYTHTSKTRIPNINVQLQTCNSTPQALQHNYHVRWLGFSKHPTKLQWKTFQDPNIQYLKL